MDAQGCATTPPYPLASGGGAHAHDLALRHRVPGNPANPDDRQAGVSVGDFGEQGKPRWRKHPFALDPACPPRT